MKLRLFRGIAVEPNAADKTIADITERGLRYEGVRMGVIFPTVRKSDIDSSNGDRLARKGEYAETEMSVCATGDEAGASHYAWIRNRGGSKIAPIMIELEVDISALAVDGRDLLYTVFGSGPSKEVRKILARAYGDAIYPHAEAAFHEANTDARFAHCDRAVLDPAVIRAHHTNRQVIAGRYGTIFSSAFQLRLPVPPAAIVRVWQPDALLSQPKPTILLSELMSS